VSRPVRAALFDLDDTLYCHNDWLDGAWTAVAEAALRLGLDGPALDASLRRVAKSGSDQGGIIDAALEAIGVAAALAVDPLVAAFRAHQPATLECFDGVVDALTRLQADVPIALVTDGDVGVQRSKLEALGLIDAFDVVVLSDELGRKFRKPHRRPFRAALARLGIDAADAVFIGDRPDKDIAGAIGVGMRAIRVRSGEYRDQPNVPGTWASLPKVVDAIHFLDAGFARATVARPDRAHGTAVSAQ
jgi:putative hydrolase of the HAD superfamily